MSLTQQDSSRHAPHCPAPEAKPRSRRPWYVPHLLTLLLAGAMAGILAWANVSPIDLGKVSQDLTPPAGSYGAGAVRISAFGLAGADLEGWAFGWPLCYREYATLTLVFDKSLKRPPAVHRECLVESPGLLWANGAVGLAIVLGVAAVVESWLRARRRLQFGVREGLVLTAAVAVVLSLWQVRASLETALGQEQLISRLFELPVWLYVPILAGMAMTLFAAIWLLLAALTWPLARLARRGQDGEALASRIS